MERKRTPREPIGTWYTLFTILAHIMASPILIYITLRTVIDNKTEVWIFASLVGAWWLIVTSALLDWHYSKRGYVPKDAQDPIRYFSHWEGDTHPDYNGPGWYFLDETWAGMYGPFDTRDLAKQALDSYTKNTLLIKKAGESYVSA